MILSFLTASGAPGATTCILGLALQWPRPILLLEASVGSPVLAGYCRGEIPHDRGLLGLLAGQRDNTLAVALELSAIRLPGINAHLVPGFTSHQQVQRGTKALWSDLIPLLQSVSAAGTDVMIDAGRYGQSAFPEPLLAASDHVLHVLRNDLPSVAAAARTVPAVQACLRDAPGSRFGALVVGGQTPYAPAGVVDVLDVPLVAAVPFSPDHAETIRAGKQPPRGFERSALLVALAELGRNLNLYESPAQVSHV